MKSTLIPVDISSRPDLLRLAEEVRETKKPRALKKDNETVAILMPVGTAVKPKKKREKTEADYEAFRAAAGSWKDVDTDTLLNDIYAARQQANTRPPVKL
jgi:hypothetical protein